MSPAAGGPRQGTAVVLVFPGHDHDLPAALEALTDRGLPATVLQDPSQSE
jgi:hypothetical protein